MKTKKTTDSKSRPKRVTERIVKRIDQTSGGKQGICEKCGRAFDQVWRPEHGSYTQFKMCGNCRMEKAHGVSKVTIPYVPHPAQKPFHDSPARFKLLSCGARFGKDRASIMEYIDKFSKMLSEDRGPDMIPAVHGWIVAPSFPLARQSWRELKAFFPRQWIVNIWEADKMIETVNDGIIEIRSADDPNALVSVGIDIVLITEAARISKLDEVWANIETRLLSPGRGPGGQGGIGLINSTPRGRTYYYNMFKWGQKDDPDYDPDWESWRYTSFDNPYLSSKDVKYLERMRNRYPDRIYRQEVLAEFLAEGNSVFPTADQCATYEGPADPIPGETYVIGWDPAQSVDFSGVAIRNRQGQCVKIEQWRKPWDLQIEEIAYLARYYNHAHVIMDRTGIGGTIPIELDKRGVSVEGVYISNREKEDMVNNLALLIERKAICYPKFDTLINELLDFEYIITNSGIIRYSASTKRKHDDLVTALYLCFKDFANAEMELPFVGMLGGVGRKRKIG